MLPNYELYITPLSLYYAGRDYHERAAAESGDGESNDTFLSIVIPLSLHYTERDYQETAAVSAGQGQGVSSDSATTETAGKVIMLQSVLIYTKYYERKGPDCR